MAEWFEDQISDEFGAAYDQPKRKSTKGESQVERYLTDWYLVKGNDDDDDDDGDDDGGEQGSKSSAPRRRHTLPEDNILSDEYVFHGYLEPNPSSGRTDRVKVCITDTSIWSLDRSSDGRGLWIRSSRAWYKLKRPCERTIPVSVRVTSEATRDHGQSHQDDDDAGNRDGLVPAVLPSQATVQLPLRAKFGLLSNLLDLMSEPYNNNSNNYVPVHARRSPANIHALLSPTPETYAEHNTHEEPLNREPFDLELLESCPNFVRLNLLNYHPLLHDSCAFMKRLSAMTDETGSTGRVWTDDDYRRSAEEAEERGQRTAWGDVLEKAYPIRPNRLIDIEIRNAARSAAVAYASKRGPASPSRPSMGGGAGVGAGTPDGKRQQHRRQKHHTPKKQQQPLERLEQMLLESSDEGEGEEEGEIEDDGGTPVSSRPSPSSAAKPPTSAAGDAATTPSLSSPSPPASQAKSGHKSKATHTVGTPGVAAHSGSVPRKEPSAAAAPPPSKASTASKAGAGAAPSPAAAPLAQNPIPKRVPRRAAGGAAGSASASGAAGEHGKKKHGPFDEKQDEIFVMTASGTPYFSPQSMTQSIRFFSSYLSPTPRDDDLMGRRGEDVDYSKYSIRDDRSSDFLDNVVQNPSVLSLEMMLLCVDCLRQSADGILDAMLRKKEAPSPGRDAEESDSTTTTTTAARSVFVVWLDHVLRMMEKNVGAGSSHATGDAKKTEVMIAMSIINLMREFRVIKDRKQLEDAKASCGIDWVDLVNRTLAVASKHHASDLVKACYFTRAHLDSIKLVAGDFAMEVDNDDGGAKSATGHNVGESPRDGFSRRSHGSDRHAFGEDAVHLRSMQPDGANAPGEKRRRVENMGSPGEPFRHAHSPPAPLRNSLDSNVPLPTFRHRDWMLFPPKYKQCNNFERANCCKFGNKCNYAHIYRPPLPLPRDAPSESALHFAYIEDRDYPLKSSDFHLRTERDASGKEWHAVALLCPKDQTIYHGAGGPGARVNSQGVHFYASVKEAMAALSGIVIMALREKRLIGSTYGPFDFPSIRQHDLQESPPSEIRRSLSSGSAARHGGREVGLSPSMGSGTDSRARPSVVDEFGRRSTPRGPSEPVPPTTIAVCDKNEASANSRRGAPYKDDVEDDGSSLSSKGISVGSAEKSKGWTRVHPQQHRGKPLDHAEADKPSAKNIGSGIPQAKWNDVNIRARKAAGEQSPQGPVDGENKKGGIPPARWSDDKIRVPKAADSRSESSAGGETEEKERTSSVEPEEDAADRMEQDSQVLDAPEKEGVQTDDAKELKDEAKKPEAKKVEEADIADGAPFLEEADIADVADGAPLLEEASPEAEEADADAVEDEKAKAKAEERKKFEEIRRKAKEERAAAAAKAKLLADKKAAAERKRRVDEAKKAEEARLAEEAQAAAEAKRLAEERAVVEAKIAEDARRKAEKERAAAEIKRLADEKAAAEKRKIDEARKAAEARRKAKEERAIAEAKRLADERAAAENEKKAEDALRAKEERLAKEKAAAEAKRLADEKASIEKRKKAEDALKAKEVRLVKEKAADERKQNISKASKKVAAAATVKRRDPSLDGSNKRVNLQSKASSIVGGKPRSLFSTHLPPRRLKHLKRKSLYKPSSGIPVSSTSAAGENSSEKGAVMHYWDTLGTCHLDSDEFQWATANPSLSPSKKGSQSQTQSGINAIIGYDKRLGRVYYSSFFLRGTQFNVGDFVVRTQEGSQECEVFRIVAAYQATKSHLGVWDDFKKSGKGERLEPTDEIQKRGHPYMLLVPLYLKSTVSSTPSKKRKGGHQGGELVLGAKCTLTPQHIFVLPEWLGEQDSVYTKIQVTVSCSDGLGNVRERTIGEADSSKSPRQGKGKGKRSSKDRHVGGSFVCRQALTRDHMSKPTKQQKSVPLFSDLSLSEFSLLTASYDSLLSNHVTDRWDDKFNAMQVQMVHHNRHLEKDQFAGGAGVKFQYTGASSDDSDGFDEDSAVEVEEDEE